MSSLPEESYWNKNIKIVKKSFKKTMPWYREALEGHPGITFPQDFAKRAWEETVKLLPRLPLHPGGEKALMNGLMPALAMMSGIHRILRPAGWSVNQIARLTYEAYFLKYSRMPGIVRFLVRRMMVSPLFSRMMSTVCRKMEESGREDTFFMSYNFRKNGKKTTTMKCRQCGMIYFMKENGLEEMFDYCNAFDFAQADAFGLGLVQPSRIGAGDTVCEYWFTRSSSDTQYPVQLQKILRTAMEL